MSRNKTAIAVAMTMIYTRPAIIAGENIKGLEVLTRDHTDGPYARASFPDEEAAERLESGFWVDHPVKLSTLDKAIAEAAQKEAEQDKRDADNQEAEQVKKEQDEKAPVSDSKATEQKDDPKATEAEKAAEAQPEAQESTQEAKADESKPKDGEKVDGAKVPTDKKAKK